MTEIAINAIRNDPAAQPRQHLNYDVVTDYAREMSEGAAFPALTVFEETGPEGSVYWLADGFHRLEAAKKAGRHMVAVDVRPGGLRDATLYSVGANATHGLNRTIEDRRRAVRRLLVDAEWSGWSDNKLAKQCAVSIDLVQSVRREGHLSETKDRGDPTPPAPDVPTEAREKFDSIAAAGGVPRLVSRGGQTYAMDTNGLSGRAGKRTKVAAGATAGAEPQAPKDSADSLHDAEAQTGTAAKLHLVTTDGSVPTPQALVEAALRIARALPEPGEIASANTLDPTQVRAAASWWSALAHIVDPQPAANGYDLLPVSPLSRDAAPKRAGAARSAQIDADFEELWRQFPKAGRQAKPAARKAYEKARKDTAPAPILHGVMRYAAWLDLDPDRKVKWLQGWLNDRRWEDELDMSPPRPSRPETRADSAIRGLMTYGEDVYGE